MNKDFFKQIRILDGGMGQELLAKGLVSMGTLWSASANLEKKFHNLVLDLHLSYINSGADVIITNTFSARRIRLIQNKVNEHFKYINEQACLLAIKAKDISKKDILIAGSLPSQRDTYVEDKRKSDEIEKDFLDQATIIYPYIDFFYLDVLSSGKELDIASNVAAKLKKPILAGIHIKKNCLLPSSESITEVVKKYRNENWLGLIGACISPEIVEKSIDELSDTNLPFGFKANLWEIDEPGPQQTFNNARFNEVGSNPNIAFGKRDQYTAKLFYKFSKKMIDKGATIVGGCCETSPEHINEINKLR